MTTDDVITVQPELDAVEPVQRIESLKRFDWPKFGSIEFRNFSLWYRSENALALKGISLKIQPHEKIGVCGRTGSGKSSLLNAIFRTVATRSGTVLIDDVIIDHIPLSYLRSHMAMIPQQPVLFSGSVRANLDPFERYSDAEVWIALEKAKAAEFIRSFELKLYHKVESRGENFSVGERQQICLARAILSKPKIFCIDEATASIDQHTDALLQQTIRDELKDCTVITIAHRLNTIMHCDRILVMEAGSVAEFDTPQNLLRSPNSIFQKLVQESLQSQ